jgi:hypothetical protein
MNLKNVNEVFAELDHLVEMLADRPEALNIVRPLTIELAAAYRVLGAVHDENQKGPGSTVCKVCGTQTHRPTCYYPALAALFGEPDKYDREALGLEPHD